MEVEGFGVGRGGDQGVCKRTGWSWGDAIFILEGG